MNSTAPSSSAFAHTGWNLGSEKSSPNTLPPIAAPRKPCAFIAVSSCCTAKSGYCRGERGEGGEAVRTRSAQFGQLFVLDLDDLGGGVAVLAIPEWIEGEDLHVDRLSIHAPKALLDDNEVLLRASGLR